MNKRIERFQAFIDKSSVEVLNPDFSKAKIYVAYAGLNRNNSSISKEVFEKAIPTIFNIPVVGEFYESKDGTGDFGTHGGKIVISDKGIEYIQTTKAYGCVPESGNPRWEMVKEEDGTEREYLVVDAILWTGRYEELEVVFENKNNQSMEILANGSFSEQGIYEISDMSFSGLCVLGSEVEPCFEGARVEMYSLEEGLNEFEEMISKYKEFMESKKEVCEEKSDEEEKMEKEEKQVFELSYRDKMNMAEDAIQEAYQSTDTWAYIIDMDNSTVIFRVYGETEKCYKASYSLTSEAMTIDLENKVEVFAKFLTQEEIDALESQTVEFARELKELTESFNAQVFELEETKTLLNKYQTKEAEEFEAIRKSEIDDVLADFEKDLSGNDEYTVIKQNAYSYANSEALEKELLLIYAKLNRKGNSTKKKSKTFSLTGIKINEEQKTTTIDGSKYGEAAKYLV